MTIGLPSGAVDHVAQLSALLCSPEATGRTEPTFTRTARRAQVVASAIDTIAEVGYEHASLALIAERAGASKGVVTYHFKDREDLVRAVFTDVLARIGHYMEPRIVAESTGAGMLRAYIESNLGFMRDFRNQVMAVHEIFVNARDRKGEPLYDFDTLDAMIVPLQELLAHFQATGEFGEFDARSVAFAIRGAIDSAPPRMVRERNLDLDQYASELAAAFVRATRPERPPRPTGRRAGEPGDAGERRVSRRFRPAGHRGRAPAQGLRAHRGG